MPIMKFYSKEELCDVINYSDLYCHPSEVEIEGIACLEAVSTGLVPVISDSKRSATKYLAIDDKNLFKCNDSVDLAKKIDYWFENKDIKDLYKETYINGTNVVKTLEYTKELGKSYTINDYLIWGGFPKSIEYDGENKKNYIYDLEETIIHNDICLRYNIKKDNIFRAVCDFVFRSNSRIVSAKSITNYIKANNEPCSINTVMKYIDYISEAFGIDLVKEYSTKIKRELSYYYKVYNADVSFNSIRVMDNRYDLDHNLENIVYNELLFKGYNVQVYRYEDNEIDFFVTKNGKSHYIQVAYSVVDNKAYEREFKAFNKMDYSYDKVLITNDTIDYSTSMVRHIKFEDFLMIFHSINISTTN